MTKSATPHRRLDVEEGDVYTSCDGLVICASEIRRLSRQWRKFVTDVVRDADPETFAEAEKLEAQNPDDDDCARKAYLILFRRFLWLCHRVRL